MTSKKKTPNQKRKEQQQRKNEQLQKNKQRQEESKQKPEKQSLGTMHWGEQQEKELNELIETAINEYEKKQTETTSIHGKRNIHGKRSSEAGGIQQLGLAPKPITTGRKPEAITPFLHKTKQGWLEFKAMNMNPVPLQMLLGFYLLVIIGMIYCLWQAYSDVGFWETFGFFLWPIIGTSVAFCFTILQTNDHATHQPPLRFHPQRQRVLFSRDIETSKQPQFMEIAYSHKFIAMSLGNSTFFTILFFSIGFNLYWVSAVCVLFLSVTIYYTVGPVWRFIQQWRAYKREVEVLSVPWESVEIVYGNFHGVSHTGPTQMHTLTLSANVPKEKVTRPRKEVIDVEAGEHPDNVFFTITVYSELEAIALYELIRDYMENGAEGIEHTAANDLSHNPQKHTRKGYRQTITEMKMDHFWLYPFWRLYTLVSFRYFFHWYLEYLHDNLQAKVLMRPDVQAWSQWLPKEEWAKPSEELTAINQAVRALYEQGYDWKSDEVQALVRGG